MDSGDCILLLLAAAKHRAHTQGSEELDCNHRAGKLFSMVVLDDKANIMNKRCLIKVTEGSGSLWISTSMYQRASYRNLWYWWSWNNWIYSVYIDCKSLGRQFTWTFNWCMSPSNKTKWKNTSHAGCWTSDIAHSSYAELIGTTQNNYQSCTTIINNRQW